MMDKDDLPSSKIDQIAMGLFCVIRSMRLGAPVAKVSTASNPGVRERIVYKLKDLFAQFGESEVETEEEKREPRARPLLVLLDRKADLHTMFYHSWSYAPLLFDVFQPRNNKFVYKEGRKMEEYELDFQADSLLSEAKFKMYQEASEEIDKSVQEWKREYDQIQAANVSSEHHQISETLTNALDKMPVMNERKKRLDMHANMATQMLQHIQQRSIDKLQDIEDEIMGGKKLAGEQLQEFKTYLQKPKESPD